MSKVSINELLADNVYVGQYDCDEVVYTPISEIYSTIWSIGDKHGVNIKEDDIKLDTYWFHWYIIPYADESGFRADNGNWYGENINDYTIRFMVEDFDMFDEITEYLSQFEDMVVVMNEEGEYVEY